MVAGQVLTLEMEVRLLPPQPKKEQAREGLSFWNHFCLNFRSPVIRPTEKSRPATCLIVASIMGYLLSGIFPLCREGGALGLFDCFRISITSWRHICGAIHFAYEPLFWPCPHVEVNHCPYRVIRYSSGLSFCSNCSWICRSCLRIRI